LTINFVRKAKTLATTARNHVENQPRDRFGRWVAKGANIKWREDGRNKIGIVKSALNGIATVEEKNSDGTSAGSTVEVPLDQVQVLASKARIPTGAAPFEGKTDDLQSTLDDPQFQTELASEGTKVLKTPSGYSLEVKDKDDTNPLTYQLYAPNGQSLGIFSVEALPALQEMIDSLVEPTESAPEEAGDTKATITPEQGEPASTPAAAGALEIITTEPKNFRVPPKVKQEIASVLESGRATFAGTDLLKAEALAYNDTVSISDIKWIGSFFSEIDAAERLRGGYNGRKWASKILAPQTPEEQYGPEDQGVTYDRYDFDDEVFDYFAISGEEGDPESFALIAVDYETGAVYVWKGEGFEFQYEVDIETFDAPNITPIDTETATELAKYIDSNIDDGYDIMDTDEEERNLFLLAEAELDYEEMDRVYAITADATGYTPQERSVNAQRQKRGPGGKFGGGQATGAAPAGQATPQFPKAKLTSELPLVADISARIEEWIATAPEGSLTAAGAFAEVPAPTATETPVEAAPEPAPAEAEAPASGAEEALYFAIVDEVDKTAVMNAFAIIKQAGAPKAYLRENAKWAESPDVLADIQGTTPPPVVELGTPEPAKTVLAQIDQHDSTQTQEATDSETQPAVVVASLTEFKDYSGKQREKDAERGYALPDGSYPIRDAKDLKNAVKALGRAKEEDRAKVKRHIRKRAKALNRMDIVPSDWRAASLVEIGEELEDTVKLFGEFGEVIVAAGGHRGHRGGNAAALKRYWTIGRGAAKIRWGTKGDLTRAHRHLAKYVGPERAWGLVQNYHKTLFGMSNYKRDNG
jgi:hypothetical protein